MTNNDFDFLVGEWDSRQRRLVKVLASCDEWYEFGATGPETHSGPAQEVTRVAQALRRR